MGASTVFKHLTVDGKQLSWPEAACIRLVDGEYEFVWRQGAVKQVLTLAVGVPVPAQRVALPVRHHAALMANWGVQLQSPNLQLKVVALRQRSPRGLPTSSLPITQYPPWLTPNQSQLNRVLDPASSQRPCESRSLPQQPLMVHKQCSWTTLRTMPQVLKLLGQMSGLHR